MKHLYALLIVLGLISTAVAEGPVLKIRIMEQRVCLLGKDCRPIVVACGSCVAVDTAVSQKGAKGYALLTAAHVVAQKGEQRKDGGHNWFLYPKDFWIEVLIGGEWKPALLKTYSKNADLALVTVGSSAPVDLVCVAEERPKPGEMVEFTGWTECTTLDSYHGLVEMWDEGLGASDSFHKATGPVVSGQSGGAVCDKNGDLVGILTAKDSFNNRIGIYTNHSEVLRFLKAAWRKDFGPQPQIDSKAPSVLQEATEPKDVPNVIQGPPKASESKSSDLGGFSGGVPGNKEQPAPEPKEQPSKILPIPPHGEGLPEVTFPDLGKMGKAPVAEAITKAEPFFKLGSLALTGLQLAGVAVPGAGTAVAVGIGVLRLWAKGRKAQVESGNGTPDTTADLAKKIAEQLRGKSIPAPDWIDKWKPPPIEPQPPIHVVVNGGQQQSPPVITVESPPAPAVVVSETRYAPFEKDTVNEALAYAKSELVKKYPGAVSTLEALEGLMEQFLAAKGVKYPKKQGE